MTRRKKFIAAAVAAWLFGAVYLGHKAFDQLRRDILDNIEAKRTDDGISMWKSIRGIMFPSFLLDETEPREQEKK